MNQGKTKNFTRIYLVRHGETDNNVTHRFIGRTDMPLNKRGQKQARYLREPMSKINIHKIYSSPYSRAMMTAEQIKGDRDIDIIQVKALAEIDCGLWEGLNREEIQTRWPGMIDLWQHNPEELRMPEGETFQQVQDRSVEAFIQIAKQNLNRSIVITTHMLTIQLIIAKMLNIPINDVWHMERLENTSITVMDIWEDGKFQVIEWGDDSHLPKELRNNYVRIAGFVQENYSSIHDLSSIEGVHFYKSFATINSSF